MEYLIDENLNTQFRDSLFRHLLEVSRIYQSELMRLLNAEKGHTQLRLSFQPVIANIPEKGIRLTELAPILGMQKQHLVQSLNQIEKIGYIRRKSDPRDRRARIVQLTPKGKRLIRDAFDVNARIDMALETLFGKEALNSFKSNIENLVNNLGLSYGNTEDWQGVPGPEEHVIVRDIITLAKYSSTQLLIMTKARGHKSLRPAHSQLIIQIGPTGTKIKTLARINDVTKQAISSTVLEMQDAGYLEAKPDPEDKRGKIIQYTPEGLQLFRDSIAATDELTERFAEILGHKEMQSTEAWMSQLFYHFPRLLGQKDARQRGIEFLLYLLTRMESSPESEDTLVHIRSEYGQNLAMFSNRALDLMKATTIDTRDIGQVVTDNLEDSFVKLFSQAVKEISK